MNRAPILLLLRACVLVFLASCSRAPQVSVVVDNDDFADLQQVQIYRADNAATQSSQSTSTSAATSAAPAIRVQNVKGVALLLGTEADWNHGSVQLAGRIAAEGWLVAGIHFDSFVAARKAQNADCLDLVTLLDVFSQHLQQRYRLASYQRPLLIGYQQGGSLAYLTLAQSSSGIFRGAVSLGLDARVALSLPFCDHDGPSGKQVADVLQLLPVPRVASRWSVWTGHRDPALQQLLQPMTAAHRHRDDIDHDDGIEHWLPAALADVDSQGVDSPAISSIIDLPLVEMPVQNASRDYFAVIISGDGGWANIDRDIGNALNARGINVIGWNSLQYFWTRRTPETATTDLARVMQHYRTQWQTPRVLLIGYSLGADVLPFMLSRSPESEIKTLASVALLGVSNSVDFEFHVSNWLNTSNSQEQKTVPELAKISALPVQCIYGSDDDDSACRNLKAPPHWHISQLPGDHHFDGAYDKVTDLILANIPATSSR